MLLLVKVAPPNTRDFPVCCMPNYATILLGNPYQTRSVNEGAQACGGRITVHTRRRSWRANLNVVGLRFTHGADSADFFFDLFFHPVLEDTISSETSGSLQTTGHYNAEDLYSSESPL
jgi:hypothetical protein